MRIHRHRMNQPRGLGVAAALAALALGGSAGAAKITIVNGNAPGVGFNDPTPVDPVGGNPGTTKGQQALNIFEYAAQIWGSTLQDDIEISILASFEPLECDQTSGVLGSAGTRSIYTDDTFPVKNTWYVSALANHFSHQDLDPRPGADGADIRARFNSKVGQPDCLPTLPWYMGLDNNHGTKTDLVTVLLHEFGHGLGFATLIDKNTGEEATDQMNVAHPDIFESFIVDTSNGKRWTNMTNAERATSVKNDGKVVFTGPLSVAAAARTLIHVPRLQISAPASLAGDYPVGEASFGTLIPDTGDGPGGDVVYAAPNDACAAITNDIKGKVVLIDRGACAFSDKAKRAQAAGAAAVLIADNADGSPPPGLGGTDPAVTITAVRITKALGTAIKGVLAGGVTVKLDRDLAHRAGAVGDQPMLYSPTTVAPGSSTSHWDVSATPNLLMEPNINGDLTHHIDLTEHLLRDIGWTFSTDIAISIQAPLVVSPGLNAVYKIIVNNVGEADSDNVIVTNSAPAGTTFVSNSGACATAFPCNLGIIAPGQSRVIVASYALPIDSTATTIHEAATVSTTTAEDKTDNNSASADSTVKPSGDLAIVVQHAAAENGNASYIVTIKNNGPFPATGITVSPAAPDGLAFVSSGGDCGPTLPCLFDTLAVGSTRTILVSYAISGSYASDSIRTVWSVTSTSADVTPDNNTAISIIMLSVPVADAGPDQSVVEQTAVTLDGSASAGNGITYSWVQMAGPPVVLANATTAKPTFTAPAVTGAPVTLRFSLTVTSINGISRSDNVHVVVSHLVPPDMSTPPDMSKLPDMSKPDMAKGPDMATAPDMAHGGGGGGGGGGGSSGGGGGCSVAGHGAASGAPMLALFGIALVLVYRRRQRA